MYTDELGTSSFFRSRVKIKDCKNAMLSLLADNLDPQRFTEIKGHKNTDGTYYNNL